MREKQIDEILIIAIFGAMVSMLVWLSMFVFL